jgi:hypothetical protein
MSRFTHLHTHSHYSLLSALPKIDDLVGEAKKLGMTALGLTDNGNLYGAAWYFRIFAQIKLNNWKPRIIVITGSSGKTTLMHFVDSQLHDKAKFSHHANSSIGVPFDILGIQRQTLKPIEWLSDTKVLLTTLYLFFAFICVFAIRDIGPTLTSDMINLLSSLSQRFSIDLGISGIQNTLSKWQTLSYQIGDFVNVISPSTDTNTILSEFLRISGIFFQILFAYILSFIWLLEYEKVQKYFSQLKKGPFAFFYRDVQIILEKIKKSFGLVFQAQSKIAVANTILTVLGLIVIGIFYGQLSLNGSYIFPYLLALGCITFFTSFVPIL